MTAIECRMCAKNVLTNDGTNPDGEYVNIVRGYRGCSEGRIFCSLKCAEDGCKLWENKNALTSESASCPSNGGSIADSPGGLCEASEVLTTGQDPQIL